MTSEITYAECVRMGRTYLEDAGVPEWEADALLLLEAVCKTDRNAYLLHGNEPVDEEHFERYKEVLNLRGKRIPLQQILGSQCFCGYDFFVNEHVLIPRQDTEILVEQALSVAKQGMKVLDMCTGSGCILLSLLLMKDGLTGTGVDLSGVALKVAAINAEHLLPEAKRPALFKGDLFGAFDCMEEDEKCFDIIVSNPPYIPTEVIEGLMPEVRDHEPRMALDGSADGLFFYRKITEESIRYLKDGGYLLYEIGFDQGRDVSDILKLAGYTDIEVIKDYAGLDRVVKGRRCK